jgi:signal transduction histidine kinase
MLLRGESVIASAGLTLAALLLCVMAGSVWWALRSQHSALAAARDRDVRAVGQMLGQSAELLLSDNELTGVRRLVAEAAREDAFDSCRITLPDGRILASAKPSEARLRDLPADWPADRADASIATPSDPSITSIPLTIPGRGSATLTIIASPPPATAGEWNLAVGVCAIGAAALVLFLWIYRRVRARLRAVGAIREALSSLASGGESIESLHLSPDLGHEAGAWNQLIAELERGRRQDVAERAREALGRRHENKGELDAACDALSHGILLVDEKCRVRYANGAAAVFLSAQRDALVGSDVTKYLQVESVLAAVKEIATAGGRRRTVHDIECREGPTQTDTDPSSCPVAGVLRFTVRPVRRDDAGNAMVTIEDITQQRVAEEARHRFVAQATHELRTPLTNIRLYVETAIDDGEDDPATRARCLNVINGETRRLERIVGEMLSVAEIEAGSFELRYDDVRLDALFADMQAEYASQAQEKQITLSFHLPPKFPSMQGDRDKIQLAMHNLLGNAMKYTPVGGRVDVSIEASDAQLSVRVKDSGIGISDADQEKIFDRFYRAKDPRVSKITGTGLGLTLAREVVRLHGGEISVESQIDRGSTFTLTVPVVKKAA